ncbi:MAG: cation-translocating P-type ATPase [Bacilli bacterium]
MNIEKIKGLTTEEVNELTEIYGKNELTQTKKESFFIKIVHVICEPMFLLLIIAATIYFLLGEPRDGVIMLVFVVAIISIEVIQEWKTDKTLKALKDLSEPKITVLRDNQKIEINSKDLVPGDIMYIYEGVKVPADGYVMKYSGLSIDESTLTGEAVPVWKTTKDDTTNYFKNNYCYQGTLVIQGTGTIKVDKIGSLTEYGKIGSNLSKTEEIKSPLQEQTDQLVKLCAYIAGVLFLLVGLFTFLNIPDHTLKDRLIESILSGITLAMAMIPEEFPVVLTIFLSMGAWRLAKKNSLVKKLSSVETLGSISVLCVDKTGTITKNQMKVSEVITNDKNELAKMMCLSSLEDTFDPMEKAMFDYSKTLGLNKKDLFEGKKIAEYPFDNNTKMVGFLWEQEKERFIAAKGSPEGILNICDISKKERNDIEKQIEELSKKGLRVIAVAKKTTKETPKNLKDETLNFLGLVGLIDPPKDNIEKDIETCKKAGVKVVMITGDNGITASSIARTIGMDNVDNIVTGDMLDKMSDEELKKCIEKVSIFSRVIPEHKFRIVKAYQKNGEIVAMTGDGVNDAPALKQANIGIAMGKRGSEVSREAADLILMDDNFSTIVDTIKDGRRIYDNIKKAVGYIFVIHIPIMLASLLGPMLGITPNNLMLLPLHVVLLELIIDPTCSIILERQPAESDIMDRPPRNPNSKLVTLGSLTKSIIQGLVLFAVAFISYLYFGNLINFTLGRTMGLLTIMFGNFFLVLVNATEKDSIFITLKKVIKDRTLIIINTILIIGIFLVIYSPISGFLKLTSLTLNQMIVVIASSFTAIFWYELVKCFKKLKRRL